MVDVAVNRLQITDKGQKATKVKCKHDESTTKQSMLVQNILFRRSISVLPELVQRRTQNFTIINKETHKTEQI